MDGRTYRVQGGGGSGCLLMLLCFVPWAIGIATIVNFFLGR